MLKCERRKEISIPYINTLLLGVVDNLYTTYPQDVVEKTIMRGMSMQAQHSNNNQGISIHAHYLCDFISANYYPHITVWTDKAKSRNFNNLSYLHAFFPPINAKRNTNQRNNN